MGPFFSMMDAKVCMVMGPSWCVCMVMGPSWCVCMVMGSSIDCNMGDIWFHCFSLIDVTKWPFHIVKKYLLSPFFFCKENFRLKV
jgi:hypothetical protein